MVEQRLCLWIDVTLHNRQFLFTLRSGCEEFVQGMTHGRQRRSF